MTEEEKEKIRDKYKTRSTGELIGQILVLTGKLIIVMIKHVFILAMKGLLWCLEKCADGWDSLVLFWNSSDTQEKKRKFVEKIKNGTITFGEWCKIAFAFTMKYTVIGAKLFWKYTCIGCRLFVKYLLLTLIAIWHGILWTLRTIKDLIIHSKPTFIRLGKSIKQGCINFGHWIVRVHRGFKLRRIRRKRAWKHFRRTKGFKGLLVDMGRGLSNGIQNFMDEEQTETSPEAITEDDIIAEQMDERQGKANEIGKKFFKGMKDIVEER